MTKTLAEFIREYPIPLLRLDGPAMSVTAWASSDVEGWPTPEDTDDNFIQFCLAMSVMDMDYASLGRVWTRLWEQASMAYSGRIEEVA